MSSLKNALQALIEKQIREQAGSGKYRIATATSLNDDGTCTATVDGKQVIAFPQYPIVPGQEVVLVFDDSGKVAAIPTRPNTDAIGNIIPPFFSGGATRFAVLGQVGDFSPGDPIQVFFQDLGSLQVFRLRFPDLDSSWGFSATNNISTFLGNAGDNTQPHYQFRACFPLAFSQDGSVVALAFSQFTVGVQIPNDGVTTTQYQYKIRLYNIGKVMKSAGDIDPANQVFILQATLLSEFTGIAVRNVNFIISATTYEGLQQTKIPMSLFVTQEGTNPDGSTRYVAFWMELFLQVRDGDHALPSPLPTTIVAPCGIPPDSNGFSFIKALINRLDGGIGGSATQVYAFLVDYFNLNRTIDPPSANVSNWLQFIPLGIMHVKEDLSSIRVFGFLPATQSEDDSTIGNMNFGVPTKYAILDSANQPPLACGVFVINNSGGTTYTREDQFPFVPAIVSSANANPSAVPLFQPLYNQSISTALWIVGSTFHTFRQQRGSGLAVAELTLVTPASNPLLADGIQLIFTSSGQALYMILHAALSGPFPITGQVFKGSTDSSGIILTISTTPERVTPSDTPPFPAEIKPLSLIATFVLAIGIQPVIWSSS